MVKVGLILKNIMDKTLEPTIALQRNLLGSIDGLFDESKDEMSVEERRNYCATIAQIFPVLEKDLKRYMQEQLKFQSLEADSWEKVCFGRGTFSGIELIYEHYKKVVDEHIDNSKGKETFDKFAPLNEI